MSRLVNHEYMTAHDARQLVMERRQPKNQALHEIVLLIEKRIQHALAHDKDDLLVNLPVYHHDLPRYDRRELLTKLVFHFRRCGFFVIPVPDRRLYISWKLSKVND